MLLLQGVEGHFWSSVTQLLALLPTPLTTWCSVTQHFLRHQLMLPEVLLQFQSLEELTTAFKDLCPGVFLFATFTVFIVTGVQILVQIQDE